LRWKFGNLAEYHRRMAEPTLRLAIHAEIRLGREALTVAELHARTHRAAKALNERYADLLATPWEVEGARQMKLSLPLPGTAAGAARLTEMVFELLLRLHPQSLGIGLGLSAEPATAAARARDACESAQRQRMLTQAMGFDESLDQPGLGQGVSGTWTVLGSLVQTWTERQAQFVRWILRDGVLDWRREPARFVPERPRKEAACAFSVSPSVVTESLQAADVTAFRHGMWSAAWQMAEVGRGYRGRMPAVSPGSKERVTSQSAAR
jgi:hypothetical protein